jgi:hypothetical protein
MDLNFQIQYKKGVLNAVADALSRCAHSKSKSVAAVSMCVPSRIQRLQEGYAEDEEAKKLMTHLSLSPDTVKDHILVDGIIRFRGRVWVGNNKMAQQHILVAYMHSGMAPTCQRVKQLFAWPSLKQFVQEFVQQC